MESIILEIYPGNKHSLIALELDYFRFPEDIDWGSVRICDNKGRQVLFDLVSLKSRLNTLRYNCPVAENTLVIFLTHCTDKLKISYCTSKSPSTYKSKPEKLKLCIKDSLKVFNSSVSISFEKVFYSIESFKIGSQVFGQMQLATSGGDVTKQFNNLRDAGFEMLADSGMLKIFKVTGRMPVRGNKAHIGGLLPVEMEYWFWSTDSKNIFCRLETRLLFEEAIGFGAHSTKYLEPLVWYRLDTALKAHYSPLHVNIGPCSNIVTLKKPYYVYVKANSSSFSMMPFLALPSDGHHIEMSDTWLGAAWHSLSWPGQPYWSGMFDDKKVKQPQGYYPAHSLNAYWGIGMFFGEGNIPEIAKSFTYPCKIRNAFQKSTKLGNPFITHWRHNSRLALNVITDDAKPNDYLWRKSGALPFNVQVAIPTRKLLGVSYSKYCLLGGKVYQLKNRLWSTILCTKLSMLRLAKDYKGQYLEKGFSLIPHMNTHPETRKLSPKEITREIKSAEAVWKKDYHLPAPLSHVFSYQSPYGLPTADGTREFIAFNSSRSLEWIREWPIPNAPVDFFLMSRLFWGPSCGGDFEKKEVCKRIRQEFDILLSCGADYMQVSGHLPEKIMDCPAHTKELFSHISRQNGVWLASADEIIRYYKCREGISFSRISGSTVEIIKKLDSKFNASITVTQSMEPKKRVVQSIDGKTWKAVEIISRHDNVAMYNINSESNYLRFL